jgi:hypothetical protein
MMASTDLSDPWTADARLDPWALVPVTGGQHVLYGYAPIHSGTGGLSWTRSSPVAQIDLSAKRAITLSGRRYDLGRSVQAAEIPALGFEPWLAFDLLVTPETEEPLVPPISADRDRESLWVACQKAARHLGVRAPGLDPDEVEAFVKQYRAAYTKKRGLTDPGGFW